MPLDRLITTPLSSPKPRASTRPSVRFAFPLHFPALPCLLTASLTPRCRRSHAGKGSNGPDPKGAVKLKNGCVVPCGVNTPQQVPPGAALLYNEFIVYSTEQIQMKYLVQVGHKGLFVKVCVLPPPPLVTSLCHCDRQLTLHDLTCRCVSTTTERRWFRCCTRKWRFAISVDFSSPCPASTMILYAQTESQCKALTGIVRLQSSFETLTHAARTPKPCWHIFKQERRF